MNAKTYEIHPIGYVKRYGEELYLEILEPYRPALNKLEEFSHVMHYGGLTNTTTQNTEPSRRPNYPIQKVLKSEFSHVAQNIDQTQ